MVQLSLSRREKLEAHSSKRTHSKSVLLLPSDSRDTNSRPGQEVSRSSRLDKLWALGLGGSVSLWGVSTHSMCQLDWTTGAQVCGSAYSGCAYEDAFR